MSKIISTPNAPAAIGPYSQGVSAKGFLFVSGQVALVPGTGETAGTAIEVQTEQCCQNVQAILQANSMCFDNVVKTTCFLTDMGNFSTFNNVYEKYFAGKPARSCMAVRELPKRVLCEIEAIAIKE